MTLILPTSVEAPNSLEKRSNVAWKPKSGNTDSTFTTAALPIPLRNIYQSSSHTLQVVHHHSERAIFI
jgi:hypothetical protein